MRIHAVIDVETTGLSPDDFCIGTHEAVSPQSRQCAPAMMRCHRRDGPAGREACIHSEA